MFSFVNEMNRGIFVIGIGIVLISIMIYIIKNFADIKNKIINLKDKKHYKKIYNLVIVLFILGIFYYVYDNTKLIFTSIENYKWSMNNDRINDYNDKQIANEYENYKNAISKNYENQNPQNPYIPEGFSHVEGEWNTGFVIQDEQGNQYVWIPCTNKNEIIEGVEKLARKNFTVNPLISKDLCINEGSEKFITSSLENGGFYISRFEIGIENDKYVSKPEKTILSNITKKEALEIVNKMKIKENLNYELINGYAYDTALSWIKNTNDIKISKYEKNEKLLTGRTSYNNVYDLVDNIMEMTSETSYENIIIRGFILDDVNSENEYLSEFGYGSDSIGRISIREEENYYTIDTIMGLRTILYK